MKFGGHDSAGLNRHRGGQESVHASHPGGKRPGDIRVHMNDLHRGVNASIGPPCADRCYSLSCHLGQRALEMVLDGIAAWLGLPAWKLTPIVGNAQRDTSHWLLAAAPPKEKRGSIASPRMNPWLGF